jgi:endoglucanase
VLDPIVAGNSGVPASTQADIHYFDKWQVQYWSHVPHDTAGDTTSSPPPRPASPT